MEKSSISEKRVKATNKKSLEWLHELSNLLDDIKSLQEEGKDDEMNSLVEVFTKKVQDKHNKLEEMLKIINPDSPVDRTNIPASGDILTENEQIILKIISPEEHDEYMEVSYECSSMRDAFEREEFKEKIWKSFNKPNAIVTSIYDKTTGLYVGYCSVNNIQKTDWEISIELKKDYQHRGYGFKALYAFIEKLTKLTGHRFYKARIDIDNTASQNLFKKLGAYPDGISEYMLHGDDLLQFQKENIQFIDDDIRAVAEEFCMEAEDILGYVLEYRIDALHKRKI